jgi:hypothetical protein
MIVVSETSSERSSREVNIGWTLVALFSVMLLSRGGLTNMLNEIEIHY